MTTQEQDEEKVKAIRSSWLGKIKSVIDSKPAMLTTEEGLAAPVEAINTASAPADPQKQKQKKAMQEYEKKVADLNKEMQKIGEDKGVDSPEYGEVHRLMGLAFR